ncbi:UvrY/SirA/GacA family response regulator transcription factor [Thiohalobacter sp. IOR34]|uniref:UvrY/SirA/GacA family response regulator transcription factor n=1 Tax=Thiohalobacter sp. IOR34 TaxID=3057176 RepID=UPI0025AF3072|nr:UvrY/SirA/GacA family response regulator transcription factor [Thiohalobacter sp. IOR34]WJW74293.1 UvrY/SirA/GacA family response regulator transcription factor [Thiohalobacter sp. IOR34]
MIKLLLVDDHELVRSGIKRILEDTPGMQVLGEASSGEEAIEFVRRNAPDVIIMDINMPGIGGLETTRKLLQIHPGLKIIVVTVHIQEPYPTRMLEAGASGYLTKHCAVDEIVDAIKAVMQGERYISADIAKQLALNMLPGGTRSPFERLSQREMQVMLMVTQGHSIQDISDRLCLSPKTVSTYRYRLYEKLGVSNDVELTHFAMRHGILDPEAVSD